MGKKIERGTKSVVLKHSLYNARIIRSRISAAPK
jgi:hypothetical protein